MLTTKKGDIYSAAGDLYNTAVITIPKSETNHLIYGRGVGGALPDEFNINAGATDPIASQLIDTGKFIDNTVKIS